MEPFRENRRENDLYAFSSGIGTFIPKREKSNEGSHSPERPQSKILITNLMEKLKEQTEKNEKLKKENSYMIKLTKKLELKASERKKTLKQLFELVTEKEKELNYYKGNVANSRIPTKNSQVIEVRDLGAENDKKKDEVEKSQSSQGQESQNELKSSEKELHRGIIFFEFVI